MLRSCSIHPWTNCPKNPNTTLSGERIAPTNIILRNHEYGKYANIHLTNECNTMAMNDILQWDIVEAFLHPLIAVGFLAWATEVGGMFDAHLI